MATLERTAASIRNPPNINMISRCPGRFAIALTMFFNTIVFLRLSAMVLPLGSRLLARRIPLPAGIEPRTSFLLTRECIYITLADIP